MRAKEIIINENVNLFEINMSPNSLRQLASGIDARAGMEFEMIVPGINSMGDPEPDYEEDVVAKSIDQVIDFFDNDGHNSRRELGDLRDQMYDAYREWMLDQFDRRSSAATGLDDAVRDELSDSDVLEILGLDEDSEVTDYKIGLAIEKVVEDQIEPYYENAYSTAQDSWLQSDHEREWLRIKYPYMSDIESAFAMNWPYYTNSSSGASVYEIADNFERAIGRPVDASESYHGAKRKPGVYVVEPDASLKPDDEDEEGGLEFVSPPLPLSEMLDDLKKVVAWAKSRGCYTNNSTGLHMNVSIAGLKENLDNLDFVKLVLLLGDEHVSQQFGRLGNYYAKSSMQKLKSSLTQKQAANPADITQFLDFMRFRLQDMASRLISSPAAWKDKFFSVHAKEGYIEFRSPGSDWLNSDLVKLESTLLRFAVVLDAAMDPEKYRQEYLTKLYKLLQVQSKQDPLFYFAQYAAGNVSIDKLRQNIYDLYVTNQYVRMDKTPKLPDSTRTAQPLEKRWGVYAPEITPAYAKDFVTAPDNYKIIKLFNAPNERAAAMKAKVWLSRIKDTMSPGQFAMIGPIEIVPYDK